MSPSNRRRHPPARASAPSAAPREIQAVYYRNCGHVIMATGDRLACERTARAVTGLAVLVATEADLAALLTPRSRRCLCRIKDRSVLLAWHQALTAEAPR